MKAVKIIAITDLGKKGLSMMKEQCAGWLVKRSLQMLKTKIRFDSNSVTIKNPAMQFCKDLKHEKSREGIRQIIGAFEELGAEENKDYKILEEK